ncbi:iron chaperone [Ornithinibacillus sp. BX22]|uniref:Iron chaperone n=1 Tax=Ornithinibacillus hominis TaxID=2763055 RepID=A0A923RIE3_9BACI|nr:iron chaperone [Ornithinibacillus hominis]MBC5637145.1 iron chaperone [Ornithinibacillus hominis]
MEIFDECLRRIDNLEHRARMEEVLNWVIKTFPNLMPVVKWNQPMFTDHGTYIIGFSAAKHHLAVAPERAGMIHFANEIEEAGLEHTKELVRFKWDNPFDYVLLEKMITFNILDKADCTTFWRK